MDAKVVTLPNQTNNSISQHDCKILQKLLSKDQSQRVPTWDHESIKLGGNIGWRQMLVPSLPSGSNFLVKAVKNYTL